MTVRLWQSPQTTSIGSASLIQGPMELIATLCNFWLLRASTLPSSYLNFALFEHEVRQQPRHWSPFSTSSDLLLPSRRWSPWSTRSWTHCNGRCTHQPNRFSSTTSWNALVTPARCWNCQHIWQNWRCWTPSLLVTGHQRLLLQLFSFQGVEFFTTEKPHFPSSCPKQIIMILTFKIQESKSATIASLNFLAIVSHSAAQTLGANRQSLLQLSNCSTSQQTLVWSTTRKHTFFHTPTRLYNLKKNYRLFPFAFS